MTEMGSVTDVRNAPIMVAVVSVAAVAIVAAIVGNGLPLLPSGLLRLALGLLLALRLGLALGLLALRLGLALCLLALRLGLLLALRLRLVLWLLGVLWLLRVLGCLRSSASALFLLAFLCERRNGGSKKQKENHCTYKAIEFHSRCLRTHFTFASS